MELEKVKEELKQARESIVKNKDVKSARVILEKCIIGDWVILEGRVNYIKLATKILLDITTKQEKMIDKIHENFCKFDWKNSNGEQVHNQLKELYESIFKNEESE